MPTFELYSPTDLEDALRFIQSSPEALVMASGTDILPRVRKRQLSPAVLLNISPLEADLRYIRKADGMVHVGALTTVTDLMESNIFADRLSAVHEAAEIFGAPQIRNVATVGGNICSASSSEDLIPVFLTLGAHVKLISKDGERSVPLKDFILEKRRTSMRASEILSEIYFEFPKGNGWTAFEKLGRRNMLIVAIVNEALELSLEDDMTTVKSAKVALNRVGGRIPALAEKTGDFLTGRRLTDETVETAKHMLYSELKLTSDFRGSAVYRVEVAQAYLKKLIQRCTTNIRRSS